MIQTNLLLQHGHWELSSLASHDGTLSLWFIPTAEPVRPADPRLGFPRPRLLFSLSSNETHSLGMQFRVNGRLKFLCNPHSRSNDSLPWKLNEKRSLNGLDGRRPSHRAPWGRTPSSRHSYPAFPIRPNHPWHFQQSFIQIPKTSSILRLILLNWTNITSSNSRS